MHLTCPVIQIFSQSEANTYTRSRVSGKGRCCCSPYWIWKVYNIPYFAVSSFTLTCSQVYLSVCLTTFTGICLKVSLYK